MQGPVVTAVLLSITSLACFPRTGQALDRMWDCSDDAACKAEIHQELRHLKELLSLNSVHVIPECVRVLGNSTITGKLIQNGCIQLVTDLSIAATRAWLPGTMLCTQTPNTCASGKVSQALDEVSIGLAEGATLPCQLLQTVGASLLGTLPGVVRLIAKGLLQELSKQLTNTPDAFAAAEIKELEDQMITNLTQVTRELLMPEIVKQSELVNNFSTLISNISDTLDEYSLPNSHVIPNQTIFLICSSIYPTCSCTSTANSSSFVRSIIRPCSWSCTTTSELLSAAMAFIPDTGALFNSTVYRFVDAISNCSSQSARYCVDRNCGRASGNYTCDMLSRPSFYKDARESSEQVCLARGDRCHYPLQSTAIPERYEATIVQSSEEFRKLVGSVFTGLRTVSNSSLLPCAATCAGILFDDAQEEKMRTLTVVASILTLVVQLFNLLTFFINRNRMHRFPTRLLVNVSLCFVVGMFGMLAQIFWGWRGVVCNTDGSLQVNLPNAQRGTALCVVTGVMVYGSLLSGLLWWLCIAHAWSLTFSTLTRVKKQFGTGSKFGTLELMYHAFVWISSAAITTAFVRTGKISGLPMFGLCFTIDQSTWFYYLTLPAVGIGVLGSPFLINGLYRLQKTQDALNEMDSARHGGTHTQSAHVRAFQAKLQIIMLLSFVHLAIQAGVGIYQKFLLKSLTHDLERNIACNLLSCEENRRLCPKLPKGPFAAFAVLLLSVYMEGIALASWSASQGNFEAWVYFYKNPLTVLRSGVPDTRRRQSQFQSNGADMKIGTTRGAVAAITKSREAILIPERNHSPVVPDCYHRGSCGTARDDLPSPPSTATCDSINFKAHLQAYARESAPADSKYCSEVLSGSALDRSFLEAELGTAAPVTAIY